MTQEYGTRDDAYLGDGVYASHDGHHICLDLRGQGTEGGTRIALEPEVFDAFVKYVEAFRARPIP